MPTTFIEAPKAKTEDAKRADNAKAPAADEKTAAAAPAAGGSGIKPWLPLIAATLTMPALAFVTTHFILLPHFERAVATLKAGSAAPAAMATVASNGAAGADKVKETANLNKLLVNVAGTMGTRYLMTSLTLVGNTADFKEKIDQNKDQLMDLATGTLSSKTISDLEKPGARNVIRAELMSVFNNALGGPIIQEIYVTEMAIQ